MGLTLTFRSAARAGSAPITTLGWDFGDGSVGTGTLVVHTYPSAGDYLVTHTVTDQAGATAQAARLVAVIAARPPVPAFTLALTDLEVTVDAGGSTAPDGTISEYRWQYGDGSTATGLRPPPHRYAQPGSFAITLTVVAGSGATASTSRTVTVATALRAAFVATVNPGNKTQVDFDATGSSGATSWAWAYGDGSTGSGQTSRHVYAASGPFTATLTVRDAAGVSSSVSRAVTPMTPTGSPSGGGTSSGSRVAPWQGGDPMQDVPSSVRVRKFSELSGADDTDPQEAIERLTQDTLVDISGEELVIPNFTGKESYFGIKGDHFLGFVGGISNKTFDNQVRMKSNAYTTTQLNQLRAQTRNNGTTLPGAVAVTSGKRSFFCGVDFVGSDQQKITDNAGKQFPVGPARWRGLVMNRAGADSLIQNSRFRAFGHSNDSTPPGECGMVSDARTLRWVSRRVELDGRLPHAAGAADPYGWDWKRGGGWQYSGSKSPRIYASSIHDCLVSGLTFSVAGSSNNGDNNSEDVYVEDVWIDDNSLRGFSGINLEFVRGPISIIRTHIGMNGTGGYHVKVWNSKGGLGDLVPDARITVADPEWSGLKNNGQFTFGIAAWGTSNTTQKTAPAVTVGGARRTASTSETANPKSNYHIHKI